MAFNATTRHDRPTDRTIEFVSADAFGEEIVAVKLDRLEQIGILYIDTERNNAINDEFIRNAHQLMDEADADPGFALWS